MVPLLLSQICTEFNERDVGCWSAEVLQAVLVYGVLASVLGDELSLSCEGSDTKGGNLRMDFY